MVASPHTTSQCGTGFETSPDPGQRFQFSAIQPLLTISTQVQACVLHQAPAQLLVGISHLVKLRMLFQVLTQLVLCSSLVSSHSVG